MSSISNQQRAILVVIRRALDRDQSILGIVVPVLEQSFLAHQFERIREFLLEQFDDWIRCHAGSELRGDLLEGRIVGEERESEGFVLS